MRAIRQCISLNLMLLLIVEVPTLGPPSCMCEVYTSRPSSLFSAA